jgi:peptide deformylase
MNDNKIDLTTVGDVTVPERHPMIYKEVPPFDFTNPIVDPIEFAHVLAQTMLKHNALGVSANQFGMPVRAFAIACNPILVCYNPKIVDFSEEMIELDEGCLSFRNMILKVKRPRVIRARFTLPNGETTTQVFQDMTARIFQHELDHLNGIAFTKRVSSLKLEKAIKEKKKRDKIEMLRRTTQPTLVKPQALDKTETKG